MENTLRLTALQTSKVSTFSGVSNMVPVGATDHTNTFPDPDCFLKEGCASYGKKLSKMKK